MALNEENHLGVSSVMELTITFIIASLIFSVLIMSFNSLFLETPQYLVTRNQFADIGNSVSTMLIDTYLVVPENGTLTTTFTEPEAVTGSAYQIQIHRSGSNDREVLVTSGDSGISVSVTLNGANSTIPINGTTNSTDYLHRIEYISEAKP